MTDGFDIFTRISIARISYPLHPISCAKLAATRRAGCLNSSRPASFGILRKAQGAHRDGVQRSVGLELLDDLSIARDPAQLIDAENETPQFLDDSAETLKSVRSSQFNVNVLRIRFSSFPRISSFHFSESLLNHDLFQKRKKKKKT